MLHCSMLEGQAREACFSKIRKPCVTIVRLYHKYRHTCVAIWKAEKGEKEEKKTYTKVDDFCDNLVNSTVVCIAHVNKCKSLKGEEEKTCLSEVEKCRKVLALYEKHKVQCHHTRPSR